MKMYQIALIDDDKTLDVTEVDAESDDEAFELAKTVFSESGFKTGRYEMAIITV